ncbi:MAG: hypothetical protein AAF394_03090 [Planctomycetota bacterium]
MADYAVTLRERYADIEVSDCRRFQMNSETKQSITNDTGINVFVGAVLGCCLPNISEASWDCVDQLLEGLSIDSCGPGETVCSNYLGKRYEQLEAEFGESIRIGVAARDYLDLAGELHVAARGLEGFIRREVWRSGDKRL